MWRDGRNGDEHELDDDQLEELLSPGLAEALDRIIDVTRAVGPALPRDASATPVANPAALQLVSTLLRPEVIEGLVAMSMGPIGVRTVPVGAADVPVAAFANLVEVLAERAVTAHRGACGADARSPAALLQLLAETKDGKVLTLTSKQLKKLDRADRKLLAKVDAWFDDEIAELEATIDDKRRAYAKDKKKFDRDTLPQAARIKKLEALHDRLAAALLAGLAHGSKLLILAGVINNEAGTSSQQAKEAIAYAYLNRTGGAVTQPKGAAISGYQQLTARWDGFGDTQRQAFLTSFVDSVKAAQVRLDDPDATRNDPTRGATHWVSPVGLKTYDARKHGADRYRRTVGDARDRAFPTWARATTDPEVPAMQRAGTLGKGFQELTATGVPSTEFLFYKDVK